jgi:hypothetical protein
MFSVIGQGILDFVQFRTHIITCPDSSLHRHIRLILMS